MLARICTPRESDARLAWGIQLISRTAAPPQGETSHEAPPRGERRPRNTALQNAAPATQPPHPNPPPPPPPPHPHPHNSPPATQPQSNPPARACPPPPLPGTPGPCLPRAG